MDKPTRDELQNSFMEMNPADWPIRRQPMTEAQRWHLRFLSARLGVGMDEGLSKAEAARRINDLQAEARGSKEEH